MRPFRPAPASLHALLLLLLALLGGCVPAASGGPSPAPDDGEGGAEHDVIARPSFHEGTPLLVAFDDQRALVVVRADDGAVVARRELGPGIATDLAIDAGRGRIVVVLEEEEADARLVEVEWTGDDLGPPHELAGTAGRARIALIHAGVLVASDADGPRVRLVRDDGEPTRGRALTAPRSWWSSDALSLVHGLELPPGGEATRFTLGVDGTGSASVVERRPLGLRVEEARLVTVASGDERVVTLEAGDVTALPLPGGGLPDLEGARTIATGVGRLEGVVGWPLDRSDDRAPCGGSARGLAVVTAEPPAVVVASLTSAARAEIPLAAEPPSGSPYGRRDVAVVGGALAVATRAGVVLVRAGGGGSHGSAAGASRRDLDAGLAPEFGGETLRGPLGCLAR